MFLLLLPVIASAQTTVKFEHDGKPVAEYRYAEVPFKPYVAQLYSPSGVAVLRDSPFDHKHHHALMFAIGADGVDFWSENDKCGRQVHKDLRSGKTELVEDLDWTAPDGRIVLREQRIIRIHTGRPATLTSPPLRSSRPQTMEMVVVLPAPFGPSSPYVSPRSMWKLTPFTAVRSP